MKFVLSSDSSCDCFKSDLKKQGIYFIPLTFTIDGVTYPDEFNANNEYKDFYQKIREGAMPTTSQINPALHAQHFTDIIKDGAKEIVHICLSGGLSATYQSACMGASEVLKEYPDCKIFVVDSLSATQAQNYLLQKATGFRDEGMTASECNDRLLKMRDNLQVWILADDLMHLKRGGRVSAAAAIIGTMLNIKPVLIINSIGGLSVVHKSKGTKKAISYFCDRVKELCPDYESASFMIAAADCDDKVGLIIKELREIGCKGEITSGWIGPVIGAHTGPGTLGLVFEGKKRIS